LHIFVGVLRVVRKTRGAHVSRTHKNYINLIGAELRRAELIGDKLIGVNLVGVNLVRAKLRGMSWSDGSECFLPLSMITLPSPRSVRYHSSRFIKILKNIIF
jgi:hypothetical protein